MMTHSQPAGEPRLWERLPGPALGGLLRDDPTHVGLIPVGAIEQHGPHLPSGTDTLIARGICEHASRRCGALVLPEIPVGCSYGHGRELPGTLSLSPAQLGDLVHQMVDWAGASGLRRLLFVNAHVGNVAALMAATDPVRLDRPDLRVGVVSWWTMSDALAREAAADGADWHANRAETSLMLALCPELVDLTAARNAADPDRTGNLVFRYTASQLSVNGVTGRPGEATREQGERLVSTIVGLLADMVTRGQAEDPPTPEFHQPVSEEAKP
jgi:creatinine amidohydrolase